MLASIPQLHYRAIAAFLLADSYAFRFVAVCIFFFQAEDGIRDYKVTGVQTCALPISLCLCASVTSVLSIITAIRFTFHASRSHPPAPPSPARKARSAAAGSASGYRIQIGRASCRERV